MTTVAVDEPLLEVSTDKVDTEIPSPVAGTLIEINAEEDETVPVGADLAMIGEDGESGGSGGSAGPMQEAEEESDTWSDAASAQDASARSRGSPSRRAT